MTCMYPPPQVTVYRLVSRNTIEERILHRAKQKDHIQKMVISGDQASSAFKGGGNDSFKATGLSPPCVCVCMCMYMYMYMCT